MCGLFHTKISHLIFRTYLINLLKYYLKQYLNKVVYQSTTNLSTRLPNTSIVENTTEHYQCYYKFITIIKTVKLELENKITEISYETKAEKSQGEKLVPEDEYAPYGSDRSNMSSPKIQKLRV